MRSFVSSFGTDLGVWCLKCHRCWTRISVQLYHLQLIAGIELEIQHANFLRSLRKQPTFRRGTQREYSSKPLKRIIVERILVFKR